MTAKAEQLAKELKERGFENVVICNNGVSSNSIYHDANNLKTIVDEWNLKGYKVVVVGYSRGGSVALYAERLGAKMAGIITFEAPIMGAQAWVLNFLGFDMTLQGTKDMVKGSQSNDDLLNAIRNGPQLPPMLEISGPVAYTVAGKYGLDIFTPIGENVYHTWPWQLIHPTNGWLEQGSINAAAQFIHSLEDKP